MFEVQTYSILDGWVNCWVDYDEENHPIKTTFRTIEDAKEGLEEFYRESTHLDINRDEYRIVNLQNDCVVI